MREWNVDLGGAKPFDDRLVELGLSGGELRNAAQTGRDVSGMLFYYCFGLYKIAVILQQIYARFVRGHTRDERFAHLNERVAALGRQALGALETGRL